jgi:hypothetical protein
MNEAVATTPERIGKYPVLQEIGRGATSVVYLCNDPFYSRNVAVKVVMPEAFQSADKGRLYRKLFVTEASAAGSASTRPAGTPSARRSTAGRPSGRAPAPRRRSGPGGRPTRRHAAPGGHSRESLRRSDASG